MAETLVFKVSFGTDNRRVTYPRGRSCHYEGLRGTIERLFSLSASPFYIAYTDDDGDETAIKSDSDLSEAVGYFQSGFDDGGSTYSSITSNTYDSNLTGGGSAGGKVTLRIQVVVEYDGPSLSDTASIAESYDDKESSYGGFGDGARSERSGASWVSGGSSQWSEEREGDIPSGTRVVIEDDWDDEEVDLSRDPFVTGPAAALPTRSSSGPHPLSQAHYPSSFINSDRSTASLDTPGSSSHQTRRVSDTHSPDELDPSPTLSPSSPNSGSGSDEGSDNSEGEDPSSDEDGLAKTSVPSSRHTAKPINGKPRRRTRKRPPPQTYETTDAETETEPEFDSYPSPPAPLPPSTSRSRPHHESRRATPSGNSHASSSTTDPFHSLGRSQNSRGPANASQVSLEGSVSSTASGLENSELGARWLQEQGAILAKKSGPVGAGLVSGGKSSAADSSRRRGESERSSVRSEADDQPGEMPPGGLELERDSNGRWYYSYSANSSAASLTSADPNRLFMASSTSSNLRHPLLPPPSSTQSGSNSSSSSSPTPTASRSSSLSSIPSSSPRPLPHHHNSAPMASSSSLVSSTNGKQRAPSLQTMFPEIPPELLRFMEEEDSAGIVEGPPAFAPACDACGIRLDYMRYSCLKCGDGQLYEQSHFGDLSSTNKHASSSSHAHSNCCEEVHHHHHHPSTTSLSLDSSSSSDNHHHGSDEEDDDGYASDGTELLGHRKSISSIASSNKPLPPVPGGRGKGFELCAGCIEEHGREHARSFFRSRAGPAAVAGRVKGEVGHTFRERVWAGGRWKDVEYDDVSACSTCNNPIAANRYKCVSCQKFDLCKVCFQKVEEIHPIHAFLSVPDRPGAQVTPVQSPSLSPGASGAGQLVQHPGAFCHNCLQNICGPRFHCAICPSWDLCQNCEGLSISDNVMGGTHQADHIMMKIPVPLGIAEVEQVSRRAREQWTHQDALAVAGAFPLVPTVPELPTPNYLHRSPPLGTPGNPRNPTASAFLRPIQPPPIHPSSPRARAPSPVGTARTVAAPSPPAAPRPPAPPAPPQSRSGSSPWNLSLSLNGISFRRGSSSTGAAATVPVPPTPPAPPLTRLGHNCRCSGCNAYINGSRYQCANCPSDPVAYNLCSTCEKRSYQIHDPMHVFLRFDRPVDFEVKARTPLFPNLYKKPAGTSSDPNLTGPPRTGSGSIEMRNMGDPTAYLHHLYHPSTVCDFCMIPITGAWYRCAVCARSFDLCSDCHDTIEHDKDHVFVVFKSDVDMQTFRELTDLWAANSRPLLTQQIYLPSN